MKKEAFCSQLLELVFAAEALQNKHHLFKVTLKRLVNYTKKEHTVQNSN